MVRPILMYRVDYTGYYSPIDVLYRCESCNYKHRGSEKPGTSYAIMTGDRDVHTLCPNCVPRDLYLDTTDEIVVQFDDFDETLTMLDDEYRDEYRRVRRLQKL